jgi:hypothetical protein
LVALENRGVGWLSGSNMLRSTVNGEFNALIEPLE